MTDEDRCRRRAAGARDAYPASPAMPTLGPELDTARAQVVARGLTVNAFGQLTPLVTSLGLSLEALGPVKQLQKRFFSDAPWTRTTTRPSPTRSVPVSTAQPATSSSRA